MRKQQKYLCAHCQSTKGILRRYSTSTLASQPFHLFNLLGRTVAGASNLIPGQIVGIINSDCRSRTNANFSFLADASVVALLLLILGEVLYLFSSGWRFNETESVSNYILWWLFVDLSIALPFIPFDVKEIWFHSVVFFVASFVDEGIK